MAMYFERWSAGFVGVGCAVVVLSACAGGQSGVGSGAVSSCKQLKRELSRYEARGVHMRADAAGRGAKLSQKQRLEVARYNGLLNSYLGNKCHV